MRNLLILSTALLLSACHFSSPKQSQQAEYLTVLHTNDNHGRFWQNEKGEYGMAARKTLIDQLKSDAEKAGHAVILLSGGDINTGVPSLAVDGADHGAGEDFAHGKRARRGRAEGARAGDAGREHYSEARDAGVRA